MERRLVVGAPDGLHARPAAQFVQAAARYQAQVTISNATAGRGPASARSILAIMALGVRQGHEVVLAADGADSDAALEALVALLAGEDAAGPTA